MPRRDDIRKILILGAGPIVIGQACEFDYSGTQACKALKEEGYEIVLVNSNPATIMTDPRVADRTYIEPILPEFVEKIIDQERPDAVLPTMGGQTALNVAAELAERGVLDAYGVKMIGASLEAIQKAEDRNLFKAAMEKIGLALPESGYARSREEAAKVLERLGFPIIVRPSFTLGGTGGGVAHDRDGFESIVQRGLEASRIHTVLIEQSLIGWKEYELEVMRDLKDNVVIICSIENLDPMGVHTGDSITVAPVQTLTDREYEAMRDAAIDVIREIGVETGGSNIQFAVHPRDGRMVVIEMNPRVSRSSALASKATGFPIAKMAAKLAVGYTLDEIPNDITKETPACFEPTIDYCVVKIPRFTFEKFPGADDTLGTAMKSVGETMSIGRTFKEALQKGLRSLEIGCSGLGCDAADRRQEILARWKKDPAAVEREILERLERPNPSRLFDVRYAVLCGIPVEEIHERTGIDPWFLCSIREIVESEAELRKAVRKAGRARPQRPACPFPDELFLHAKALGFSDRQLASIAGTQEGQVRSWRRERQIRPVFKLVDTCAAEFEAYTPYFYSTYEREDEARSGGQKRKVMILGGGPNRIGQGIEFDYCCVQASYALREEGVVSIMVNSNPETVSTDYDTSDRLYFEPLTLEDVLHIVENERPEGVIVQFGGQTPLNLAVPLQSCGVPILGTSPDSIDRAEDRRRFKDLLDKLGLVQPDNDTATSFRGAKGIAREIGYPVVVRPSYVLGGRAMEICYDEEHLEEYMEKAVDASRDHPILIDKYLEDAVEIDVDAVGDGTEVRVGGIMEHVEEAGIHSGDSACAIPPYTLSDPIIDQIGRNTVALALELNVRGLMNVQYAVKDDRIYVLEVNPRASRTVPFVSKAVGISLAKIATKVMLGGKLRDLWPRKSGPPGHIAVKESVFPFSRFPGVDAVLGPEMKSTGEVMGLAPFFGMAFAKSQLAAGQRLPQRGNVFISLKNKDKRPMLFIAKRLHDLGFRIYATRGTARTFQMNGIAVELIRKVSEGHPNVVDLMKQGQVDLIVNTPSGKTPRRDEISIRSTAVAFGVPLITTVSGASATVNAIETISKEKAVVKALQDYHEDGGDGRY
ncbi:MAG: carbamoyl-phosphate synthase large subunit [bacterium]